MLGVCQSTHSPGLVHPEFRMMIIVTLLAKGELPYFLAISSKMQTYSWVIMFLYFIFFHDDEKV